MCQAHKQSGMTLIAVMSMLVLITLLAVSMIRGGTLNLQIAQNVMLQQETQAATQRGIELFMSNLNNFTNTNSTLVPIALPGDPTQAYQVEVDPPICLAVETAPGHSEAGDQSFAEDESGIISGVGISFLNYWQIRATGTDTAMGTGNTVRIVQGVRIIDAPCM